jgi:hypothetical protein
MQQCADDHQNAHGHPKWIDDHVWEIGAHIWFSVPVTDPQPRGIAMLVTVSILSAVGVGH